MPLKNSWCKFGINVALGMVDFLPAALAILRGTPNHRLGPHDERSTADFPLELGRLEEFLLGTIHEVHSNRLLVRVQGGSRVNFLFSVETTFWDNRWVKDIPIKPGDEVLARGSLLADRSFEAMELYINMVDLSGVVAAYEVVRDSGSLQLLDREGTGHRVLLDPRTSVLSAADDMPSSARTLVPLGGREVQLAEGQSIQVIGRQTEQGLLAVSVDAVGHLAEAAR